MRAATNAPGTGWDALRRLQSHAHAISVRLRPASPPIRYVRRARRAGCDGSGRRQRPRAIPLVDFHRLPEDTPQTDTNLQPDELITAVELPAPPRATQVSCATAPAMRSRSSRSPPRSVEDGTITQARLALGGVAHKPWRAFAAANSRRRAAVKTPSKRQRRKNPKVARGYQHIAFKIELAKRTMMSVLTTLANEGGAR